MAGFGPIASPAPNVLYNPMAIDAAVMGAQRNRLMMEQATEDRRFSRIDREREEVGRVAASLLSLPADQRPQAYAAARADMQRAGIGLAAPEQYPGDTQVEQMARAAMPAAMQFQLAEKRRASEAMMGMLGGFLGGGEAMGAMGGGGGGPGFPVTAPAAGPAAVPPRNYEAGEAARAQLLEAPPAQLAQASAERSTVPERPGGYRAPEGVGGAFRGLPPPTGAINPNVGGGLTPAQRAAIAAAAMTNPSAAPAMIMQAQQQNAMAAERAGDNQRQDLAMRLQEARAQQQAFQAEQSMRLQAQAAQRADETARRQAEALRLQNDPEHQGRLAEARRRAETTGPTPAALKKLQDAEAEANRVIGTIDRFGEVFREQGGVGLNAFLNNPRDPAATRLNTAYNNLEMVMRSEALMNTGVLQPAEAKMLRDRLLSPTSLRGAMATPAGMQAQLDELKAMVQRGVETQRAALGGGGGGGARNPAPASAPSGAPQPGTVEDGYRFKGGNPADPASWERVR